MTALRLPLRVTELIPHRTGDTRLMQVTTPAGDHHAIPVDFTDLFPAATAAYRLLAVPGLHVAYLCHVATSPVRAPAGGLVHEFAVTLLLPGSTHDR